jgi:hypothetical protein
MKRTHKSHSRATTTPPSPQEGQRDDARDVTDRARDERLLQELQENTGRDPLDRHRERITPVESEQDGVRDDEEDDERGAQALRAQAIREQDADDPGLR